MTLDRVGRGRAGVRPRHRARHADGTSAGPTRIAYRYEAAIGGKVASIGGRLLDGAARVIIGRFFGALARTRPAAASGRCGRWHRVRRAVRRRRVKLAPFDYVRAASADEALDGARRGRRRRARAGRRPVAAPDTEHAPRTPADSWSISCACLTGSVSKMPARRSVSARRAPGHGETRDPGLRGRQPLLAAGDAMARPRADA